MSCSCNKICLKCSLVAVFMLFFQVGFSQYNFQKAGDWMRKNLDKLGGRAVLVIVKDGEIVYNHSENNLLPRQRMALKFIARRNHKDENQAVRDLSFTSPAPIASCSKWLSAAVVMTFVDEGKLRLEDTVGKFIPVLTKYGKGNITITDCLAHLTGINGGNGKRSRELITDNQNMDEVMEKIAVLPMEGKPGTVFHYSNIGLEIAATVVEKISGKDFKELLNERIAIPCDMKNTNFGTEKIPLAAGGIISTPEDYIHFLQMILQNGMYDRKNVLSKGSVIKMQQDYTSNVRKSYSPDVSGTFDYGLGEWILEKGKDRAKVVSSPGLFGSFPWVNNERKYAGFLFVLNINSQGREEGYKELQNIIDEQITN